MGKRGNPAVVAEKGENPTPSTKDNPRKGLTRQQRQELSSLIENLLQKCSTQFQGTTPTKCLEIHADLVASLERVRELEKNASKPQTHQRAAAFRPFLEWLSAQNAKLGPVELAEIPLYGYAVKATADIKEGEQLFTIPQSTMMTVETARKSKLGKLIQSDPLLGNMPNVALALHVLNEKHSPDSFWKHYIEALPAEYDTVMYFSTSEMEELKGSPALEEAVKMCRSIARQYAFFYSLLQNLKDPGLADLRANFTYDEYRWAVSTVMTRQNLIPDASGSLTVNALIPLWDFCNHQEGKPSTDFDATEKCCSCLANRDFVAGDQVFIFYGPRSCADQLLHNGFVDINNSFDSVLLRLGLSRNDPLAQQRAALLHKLQLLNPGDNGLDGPLNFRLKTGTQPIDGQLLAFLRVFCMSQDSLQQWLESEHVTNLLHGDCGIETQVETKVWNFLLQRCQLLLKIYPTTKDEDVAILQTAMSTRRRACVLLRLSEKRILHSAIEFATRMLEK